MGLAKRYGLATAKWVFLVQFGAAAAGLGAFQGKDWPERLAGGAALGLAAGGLLGLAAAVWGWWRQAHARHTQK